MKTLLDHFLWTGNLEHTRRSSSIYFKASVGDNGGANVASGLVCWS